MNFLLGSLVKQSIDIEAVQKPTIKQVTRVKTAVIVKQDKQYLENNKFAGKFYDDLTRYLRDKGFAVSLTASESNRPPDADLWISHGGINAPKGTKHLILPQYARPFFTKLIASQIDKLTS